MSRPGSLLYLHSWLIVFVGLALSAISAEDNDRTLAVLDNYSSEILKAAEKFEVPSRLLAAAIYADRRMHYNLLDHSLDVVIAQQGRNNSIGIAQIRVTTGQWICSTLRDSASPYYLGMQIPDLVPCSVHRDSIIQYLIDPSRNLMLAGAYCAMILKRWQDAGIDLRQNVEVFATLYNLGPYHADGTERAPHIDARSNEYGYVAKDFYKSAHLREILPVESHRIDE